MKASLFEILLNLFEKTLTELKEKQQVVEAPTRELKVSEHIATDTKLSLEVQILKQSGAQAMRVFSRDEQLKLTKASYQFLLRLNALGVVPVHIMELVLNRLFFSDSRFVSLQETKWTIRNTLAQTMDPIQLSFLDLVLYFKEDGLLLH